MPFDRSLTEVLNDSQDALLDAIRKVAVGFVTAVNGQRVDVQLAVAAPLFSAIDGTVYEPPHALGDVPLCALRGGGFMVWLPIAVGDPVLVLFTDISADAWRTSDGQTVVNPGWVGRHTQDSAFAIPMIAPDSKTLASADPSKLVIGKDGGPAVIKIGSTIELGASATDTVALAEKVTTELNLISATLASLSGAAFGVPYHGPSGPLGSSLVKISP